MAASLSGIASRALKLESLFSDFHVFLDFVKFALLFDNFLKVSQNFLLHEVVDVDEEASKEEETVLSWEDEEVA